LVHLPLPGWHGKLPAQGDFVSRRLDPDYIEVWDHWLSEGMLALCEQLGDDWLDAYLASPSWRFLLMPGVLAGSLGVSAWAGVLMPSVDRVGRYFPFTLVQPLDARLVSSPQMPALWHWLERLDDLAADALHEDWDVERLETELARNGGPDLMAVDALPTFEAVQSGVLTPTVLSPGLDPASWIALEAHALWSRQAAGVAYWYAQAEQSAPRWLRSSGLPIGAAMTGLFGGAAPSAVSRK
jgi:type VI secretion system protein ImpM